jgi:hypothetical protein
MSSFKAMIDSTLRKSAGLSWPESLNLQSLERIPARIDAHVE